MMRKTLLVTALVIAGSLTCLPASADAAGGLAACPGNHFCLYSEYNWGGPVLHQRGAGCWFDNFGLEGKSDKAYSAWNRTPYRVNLANWNATTNRWEHLETVSPNSKINLTRRPNHLDNADAAHSIC